MISRKKAKDIAVGEEGEKDFEIKIKVRIGEKTIEEDLEDALYKSRRGKELGNNF